MKELFGYSLMASALGILIVFVLLVILSALMLLIRYLSDDFKFPKKTGSRGDISSHQTPEDEPGALPDWLAAAVGAYLSSEEKSWMTPSAAPWKPSESEKYDRWMIPGRKVNK